MSLYTLSIVSYSVLLIIGGYFGHQAGSIISLVVSVAFGLSLLILLALALQHAGFAYSLINVIMTILTLFFAMRWYTTGKFMPGGLLFWISLVVLLIALFHNKGKD
ncbi:MAG: TMEM14 family protein [Parachlamydiaceae bacterium]